MFNLLPSQQKKILAREYQFRFIAVALFFLGSIGLFALVLLFPSYILSSQKQIEAERAAGILKKQMASGSKDDLATVFRLTEKQATVLNTATPVSPTYDLIDSAIRAKTSDIAIIGFIIVRNEDNSRTLSLTGTAVNRDTLLSFVHILEQDKNFKSVTAPVSNFAESKN